MITTRVLGEGYVPTRTGLYVPPTVAPPSKPKAIDLFAGAGGFSLGFHQAGWDVVAAVEYDRAASATYLCNLGSPSTIVWSGPALDETLSTGESRIDSAAWSPRTAADVMPQGPGTGWINDKPDQHPVQHLWCGDIRTLNGSMILDALGLQSGEVDAVIGGPPCQGFSRAGKRNVMDPRNSLVFDFARIVCEIQPKTFVMENVPGILDMVTPEGVPVLDAFALEFEYGGMGEFGALRRSLFGTGGRIGAIKGKPAATAKKAAVKARAKRHPAEIEQGVLF